MSLNLTCNVCHSKCDEKTAYHHLLLHTKEQLVIDPEHPLMKRDVCVVCKKDTTYIYRGEARWHNDPKGRMCHRCWSKQYQKSMSSKTQ